FESVVLTKPLARTRLFFVQCRIQSNTRAMYWYSCSFVAKKYRHKICFRACFRTCNIEYCCGAASLDSSCVPRPRPGAFPPLTWPPGPYPGGLFLSGSCRLADGLQPRPSLSHKPECEGFEAITAPGKTRVFFQTRIVQIEAATDFDLDRMDPLSRLAVKAG